MKRISLIALLLALFVCVGVHSVSAHQESSYEINGVAYDMEVGSLNEPVVVDDKTGAVLILSREGKRVTDAQSTLKVEISAGDKKQVMGLDPSEEAGNYSASYIATVPTAISYRIFGTLENTPVDLSFACSSAGDAKGEGNDTKVTLSPNVVRTHLGGGFGCPEPRALFGFPEPAPDSSALTARISALEAMHVPLSAELSRAKIYGTMGVGVGILGIVIALIALMVARKKTTTPPPLH